LQEPLLVGLPHSDSTSIHQIPSSPLFTRDQHLPHLDAHALVISDELDESDDSDEIITGAIDTESFTEANEPPPPPDPDAPLANSGLWRSSSHPMLEPSASDVSITAPSLNMCRALLQPHVCAMAIWVAISVLFINFYNTNINLQLSQMAVSAPTADASPEVATYASLSVLVMAATELTGSPLASFLLHFSDAPICLCVALSLLCGIGSIAILFTGILQVQIVSFVLGGLQRVLMFSTLYCFTFRVFPASRFGRVFAFNQLISASIGFSELGMQYILIYDLQDQFTWINLFQIGVYTFMLITFPFWLYRKHKM
jgi:hypothetical protein